MSVFITGSDTGVGKTVLACRLLEELRSSGIRAAGFKPICCGDRGDAEKLLEASEPGLTIDDVNPVWLKSALAPMPAAEQDRVSFNIPLLIEAYNRLAERHDAVIVEGVGGWLVPISRDYFIRDLAMELNLPVMVVSMNRLGCLSHTLLTVESVAASRLQCIAVILNDAQEEESDVKRSNRAVLQQIQNHPVVPMLSRERDIWRAEWDALIETVSSSGRVRSGTKVSGFMTLFCL